MTIYKRLSSSLVRMAALAVNGCGGGSLVINNRL